MAKGLKEEQETSVPGTTLGDVLDAVKELTSTTSELIKAIDGMRKEYGLKTRAGIFDQKGIT